MFTRVRPVTQYGSRHWHARCIIKRCKFDEEYMTHNGAQIAAKRHRRDKAHLKSHGGSGVARGHE